jgi:Putative DNA-binding domain
MKPLQEWDEAFLDQHFVKGKIQEGNSLDYKDSRSLSKADTKELCKDTTAFANAGGGMIIYGITEDKHEPTGIDQGTDRTAITKEWIEDILTSNIRPKIEDLEIVMVPLPSKRPQPSSGGSSHGAILSEGSAPERKGQQILSAAQL